LKGIEEILEAHCGGQLTADEAAAALARARVEPDVSEADVDAALDRYVANGRLSIDTAAKLAGRGPRSPATGDLTMLRPGSTGAPAPVVVPRTDATSPEAWRPEPRGPELSPPSLPPDPSAPSLPPEPSAPSLPPGTSGSGSSGWRRWAESEHQSARIGVGDVLRDRFVIEQNVGEGGMGLVFRARDKRREEARDRHPFVAIKLLGDDFKTHPDSLIALQREARRMQQLSHPNIAAVYDFDRDGPHVYLVMELLEGESLDKILARHPNAPLPRQLARSVIEGAGDALRHAHSRGVVHSDFKPANVFVTRSGEVKVIDFGIARIAKDTTQGAETTMTVFDAGQLGAWTNAYASPEQILRAADPDPRDDIYAFGLVAYEMLSGKHPFAKKSAVEARFREMKLEPIAGLTGAQNDALAAALHFDRDQRLTDISTLIRAFADEDEPIVATRDGAPRAAQRPAAAGGKGRGRWRIAGLAILVLAWIAFFAVYRMTRDSSSPDATVSTAEKTAPSDPPREPPPNGSASSAPAPAAAATATATVAAPQTRPPNTSQPPPSPPTAGSSAPEPPPPAPARAAGESESGRVAATAAPPEAQSGADTSSNAGSAEAPPAAGAVPAAGVAASADASSSRSAAPPAEASSETSEASSTGESPAVAETPPAAKPSLYRWVDKDGKVQFGEKPPEEYADSAVKVMDL